MIDAEARISSKEHNEHLSARQSCIQTIVRFLLVCPALLENHAHIADSEVAWPAVTDTFLYELATCLAHPAQVIVSRKNNSLILWQRVCPGVSIRHKANSCGQRCLIQGNAARVEPRELLKLHGCAA